MQCILRIVHWGRTSFGRSSYQDSLVKKICAQFLKTREFGAEQLFQTKAHDKNPQWLLVNQPTKIGHIPRGHMHFIFLAILLDQHHHMTRFNRLCESLELASLCQPCEQPEGEETERHISNLTGVDEGGQWRSHHHKSDAQRVRRSQIRCQAQWWHVQTLIAHRRWIFTSHLCPIVVWDSSGSFLVAPSRTPSAPTAIFAGW